MSVVAEQIGTKDILTFTPEQAKYADSTVLDLIRQRVASPNPDQSIPEFYQKGFSHNWDPSVLVRAHEIMDAIKASFDQRNVERSRAINADLRSFDLSGDWLLDENPESYQSRVTVGQWDICSVFPLTAFTQFMAESREDLIDDIVKRDTQYKPDQNDWSQNDWAKMEGRCNGIASAIFSEWESVQELSDVQNRCVVLAKTRSNASYYRYLQDWGLTSNTPHLMSYLTYKLSFAHRIVPHNHIVFANDKDHVCIAHWAGKGGPGISYCDRQGWYDCEVYVPLIF